MPYDMPHISLKNFIPNSYSAESDGLLVAHLPPIATDTCQLWYSDDEIDIDFNVHKCFGYEDGQQERFIDCQRLIDAPIVKPDNIDLFIIYEFHLKNC